MRNFARIAAACLGMLTAGAALGAEPVIPAPSASSARIVVALSNNPQAVPSLAGATGSRYGGSGYRVTQSARQQAHRIAVTYSLRQVASWPIEALSMHCVVFEIGDARPVATVLAALSKDSRVLLAQPLNEFHTLSDPPAAGEARAAASAPYNDPLYDLQTNLATLGIAGAHQHAQGAGARVALIDTGVDAAHPDLKGRIHASHSFLATRPPAASYLRHGTAMAGIITAVANNHIGIVGIAPLAQLEVFAACWQLEPDKDAAACNTFTLAQALAGALASGAPLVNLSFAGPADPLLTALVQSGQRRGVIFVGAAAGPDAPFPTAIPGVLAASGSEHPLPAGALGAPAEHVLTLRPGGQYDFESGTSVAAAELSGVIALLISATPVRLSASSVASLLTASRSAAAAGGEAAGGEAASLIDVNAALARLDEQRRNIQLAAHGAH